MPTTKLYEKLNLGISANKLPKTKPIIILYVTPKCFLNK